MEKPTGRLRGAIQVFLGRRMTPVQIEAEWREYQQIFDSILTRLGAQLARQAKAERERIKALSGMVEAPSAEPAGHAMPEDPRQRKLALWGKVHEQRAAAGGGPVPLQIHTEDDNP